MDNIMHIVVIFQDSAVIQQTMIPEIEQSLSQKCTSLLSSYSPSNDDGKCDELSGHLCLSALSYL